MTKKELIIRIKLLLNYSDKFQNKDKNIMETMLECVENMNKNEIELYLEGMIVTIVRIENYFKQI